MHSLAKRDNRKIASYWNLYLEGKFSIRFGYILALNNSVYLAHHDKPQPRDINGGV